MRKATNFEVSKRVNKIYLFIIKGKSDDYICQYSSKYWKVTERQLARYMERAVKKFEKKAEIQNNKELGKALAQSDDLYDRSYQIENYSECRQVLRDRIELLRIKKPTEVNVKFQKQIEKEKKGYELD